MDASNSDVQGVLKAKLTGRDAQNSSLQSIIKTKSFNDSDIHIGDGKLVTVIIEVPINYGEEGNCQLSFYVENPSSNPVYIDDFKVQPLNAPVTSYVYDDKGRVSAILDNEHFATYYEYDEAGRLKATYKETIKYGKVKVSEHEQHYARDNE